jgi:hypothetical protein
VTTPALRAEMSIAIVTFLRIAKSYRQFLLSLLAP